MRTAATAGGLMVIGAAVVAAHRARVEQIAETGAAVSDYVGGMVERARAWVSGEVLDLGNENLRAFLMMLRYAEGTAGANGYRMLFGGRLFDSFEDHPRVTVTARTGGREIASTAAGAYQILSRTWDGIKGAAGVSDFTPESQDRAAAALIRRRGALGDVYAGRFADAVRKVAREWASLPGSPYGQPVRTFAQVEGAYIGAGGWVA